MVMNATGTNMASGRGSGHAMGLWAAASEEDNHKRARWICCKAATSMAMGPGMETEHTRPDGGDAAVPHPHSSLHAHDGAF